MSVSSAIAATAEGLRNLERRLRDNVGRMSRDLLLHAASELERLDDALLGAMTARERSAQDLGAERARLKTTVEANLERTTALAKAVTDMESRHRTTLGHYNNLVLRYDELQQAGERVVADRQVQVDALLARIAELESQLADRAERQKVETEQLRGLSDRLAETGRNVDELVAKYGRLLVAFHDATRRPLGVTPDSGREFYDARMADDAEARYSRHGRGRL